MSTPTQEQIDLARVRLECVRIALTTGTINEQETFETKAERIYTFVVGDNGAKATPPKKVKQ